MSDLPYKIIGLHSVTKKYLTSNEDKHPYSRLKQSLISLHFKDN